LAFTAQNSLDDDVISATPEQVHVNPDLLQMVAERGQRPFIPYIILLAALIFHEFVILFIDRVVSQVHEAILLVESFRVGVAFGRKARQSLFKDVDAERLVAGHHYVDSEVEFVAVNEEGVLDVPRNNCGVVHIDIIDVIDNMDAPSLR